MKNIIHTVFLVFAVYILYVLVIAFIPYIGKKSVSQSFVSDWKPSDLYGTAPCIDRVALVEEPLESLGTRIHMLDEAVKRIDVSYYAIHMGETTDLFLAGLIDAADRGVKVRILVDGMAGGLTGANKQYATALAGHENIELKIYNPINILKPWTFNGRLHDKYIIIDDRILLLGGRNIGDKYFGPDGFDSRLSIDRDVLVYNTAWESRDSSSVLFEVRSYMDSIWESKYVRQPYESDTDKAAEKREELKIVLSKLKKQYPELFKHEIDDYTAWTFPAKRITFLHNDITIGRKEPKVGYALGEMLRGAKQSVTLQSPYIVLDKKLKNLLKDLGDMDIDYAILTNSMASSPNLPAFSAYLGDRKEIIDTGAHLYEYQSTNAIHAKSYLIDGRMAIIGSYNLDPRSAYIDTELILTIDSEEFAAHFAEVQQRYIDQSLQVDTDGKYVVNSAVPPTPVSTVKKVFLSIMSLPIRLIKCLV